MIYHLISSKYFVIALLATIALVSCGKKQNINDNPTQVSLAMLASDPDFLSGRQVLTQGTVRYFKEPLHYWIEDEKLNRVEILPQQLIAPYLGQNVVIRGKFLISENGSRQIMLIEIN